ncbi:unnamed protein product [Moneuplotes crassus]|uniref:Uncharacterized protein n=1 Tax=Euplotes crassus TaxID=5936 RepID=A0AAD1UTD9_EUPCR|nr:unnamed protein product [Moneuplotes crassus]
MAYLIMQRLAVRIDCEETQKTNVNKKTKNSESEFMEEYLLFEFSSSFKRRSLEEEGLVSFLPAQYILAILCRSYESEGRKINNYFPRCRLKYRRSDVCPTLKSYTTWRLFYRGDLLATKYKCRCVLIQ